MPHVCCSTRLCPVSGDGMTDNQYFRSSRTLIWQIEMAITFLMLSHQNPRRSVRMRGTPMPQLCELV
jgi:hypothetical protein